MQIKPFTIILFLFILPTNWIVSAATFSHSLADNRHKLVPNQ